MEISLFLYLAGWLALAIGLFFYRRPERIDPTSYDIITALIHKGRKSKVTHG